MIVYLIILICCRCWDGKLAYMAKMDGFTYPQMLGMILKAAQDRVNREASINKF
jgi:hypothetical protein